MSELPPLPRYLTLEEAAAALTERTGKQWTQRQVLGCAERHEIALFARIGHAVKFVRKAPIEGRTNEISAAQGSVPCLDTEAIRGLLLTGEADSTGWEELGPVNFFGEPAEAWQKVFELAPGQEAPRVTPDVCRVTANGLLRLIDAYQPAVSTVAPIDGAQEASPDAPAGDAAQDMDWRMRVQAEAAAHWLRLRKLHCNPTKYNILPHLAKWCRENNVRTSGPSGIHPSEGYLKNVLVHWKPPR